MITTKLGLDRSYFKNMNELKNIYISPIKPSSSVMRDFLRLRDLRDLRRERRDLRRDLLRVFM